VFPPFISADTHIVCDFRRSVSRNVDNSENVRDTYSGYAALDIFQRIAQGVADLMGKNSAAFLTAWNLCQLGSCDWGECFQPRVLLPTNM
jgi:hypothetical protein